MFSKNFVKTLMFPSSLTINPQNLSPSLFSRSFQRAYPGDAAGPRPHQRRGEVQAAAEQVMRHDPLLMVVILIYFQPPRDEREAGRLVPSQGQACPGLH